MSFLENRGNRISDIFHTTEQLSQNPRFTQSLGGVYGSMGPAFSIAEGYLKRQKNTEGVETITSLREVLGLVTTPGQPDIVLSITHKRRVAAKAPAVEIERLLSSDSRFPIAIELGRFRKKRGEKGEFLDMYVYHGMLDEEHNLIPHPPGIMLRELERARDTKGKFDEIRTIKPGLVLFEDGYPIVRPFSHAPSFTVPGTIADLRKEIESFYAS